MKKRKNHSPEFEATVVLEAIHEEITLAELPKKHGVHPIQIGTWKRAATLCLQRRSMVSSRLTMTGPSGASRSTSNIRRWRLKPELA